MKLILVVFSILVLGFSALAANDDKTTKTEAGFFGPGGCEICQAFANKPVPRNSTHTNFNPTSKPKHRNTDKPKATTDR